MGEWAMLTPTEEERLERMLDLLRRMPQSGPGPTFAHTLALLVLDNDRPIDKERFLFIHQRIEDVILETRTR